MKKCEQTFQKLKQACISKSVLQMFNLKKSIHIEMNALNFVIEECLMQEYNGK